MVQNVQLFNLWLYARSPENLSIVLFNIDSQKKRL